MKSYFNVVAETESGVTTAQFVVESMRDVAAVSDMFHGEGAVEFLSVKSCVTGPLGEEMKRQLETTWPRNVVSYKSKVD